MRGVFTAGVLDAFMKHEIYFRHVVAVSAGAGNGLSYMSRQPRRAHVCNIDLLTKYDYIGLRHLFTQGCIFDPHLLYERFPYELIPYDYDAYYRYARRGFTFEMVTTNCLTGRADYLTETSGDPARLNRLALASASLPFVAPPSPISTARPCSTEASSTASPWSDPSHWATPSTSSSARAKRAGATRDATASSRPSSIATIRACAWR